MPAGGQAAIDMANAAKVKKPVSYQRPVSAAASTFAKKAVKNVMTNKLIPVPTNSKGGRVTPAPNKTVAPKTAAPTSYGPTTAPPTSDLAPEDQALAGQYPTDLNINQNTKLAGLAGQVQLPNALNYANSMANLQYGPQIQATASRIKGLIAALPGAMDALNKAYANVDAQRALTAPITSGQGVANLFGGAQGAAATAANQAVQANNTTANQIGQGNDESQANARRQADWATRIQLLNNMAVNQGRTDLQTEQGQLGNAKKGYYDQGLKMRGDMISQAIGNQGALQNQKIAAALASGQIEGMKLSNEQKQALVKQMGIQNAYLPEQLQTGIQGQKQSIVTSALNNKLNAQQTAASLAKLNGGTGVTKMSDALKQGGPDALTGMILPPGAVVQDATTGRPQVFGDLNTYFNKGVDRIMQTLPQSDRKRVKQYVANVLQTTASATNQWVYKNGRFQKVQPKK